MEKRGKRHMCCREDFLGWKVNGGNPREEKEEDMGHLGGGKERRMVERKKKKKKKRKGRGIVSIAKERAHAGCMVKAEPFLFQEGRT